MPVERPPGPEPVERPPSAEPGLGRRLMRWESGLALAVIAVVIFGTRSSDQFLTGQNLFHLFLNSGEIAIMVLPMTLIIITGEIDLSVASILGMSSALLGYLWSKGWPMPAIFVVVIAVGVAAGAFNGILVTRVGLPSLAVTIGTLGMYRGVADIVLGPNTVSTFPATYTNMGVEPLPGTDLSFSAALFIVLAIVFGIVLHATPAGRSIYAMGANEEAARFAGIRVKRIKLLLFITSGVICSICGILWTFRLATAVQDNGLGLELDVVAIALLGGISIFGGRGSIIGIVLAVLLFAGLQNALLLTNFNQEAAGLVTGGLLLISVLVPNIGTFVSLIRERIGTRQRLAAAAEQPAEGESAKGPP